MENLIYKIELKGQDKIGSSVLEGVIIFKENGFGIKLSKTYKDKEKANQIRKFSFLFYEGEGNWDLVLGNWYFLGF